MGGVPISDALGQCGHPHDDDFRATIENEVRYANITIIEGIGASQYGIGMVCARIAEIVLRDERAVVPIGVYSSKPGVTLSLRRMSLRPNTISRTASSSGNILMTTLQSSRSPKSVVALRPGVSSLAIWSGRRT